MIVTSLRPRTVVVVDRTYYYYYYPSTHVWYVKSSHNGQEGYVVVSPPANYEVDQLPTDAKEVKVEDQVYYFSKVEGAFYIKIERDGKTRYVIVDAPLGALVDALPDQAIEYEEDGDKVYQYGETYYVMETDPAGKAGYVVTAPPASEVVEVDEMAEDTITMEVDGTAYYYMDGAFYLPDRESGENVYSVAEPPLGGNVETVPDGSVVFTIDGMTYYQFDNVFFTQAEDDGFTIVAEPGEAAGTPP
ncbi:MAG: hypothetical protein JSV78_13930 [Phycisphaerales bacterium]|nr:MAG: hypothetical protein JSV78_13930 [Phycisphaerales bacterium]